MAGSVRKETSALVKYLPAIILSLCSAAALTYMFFLLRFVRANHDQSWYLYAAQRLLAGVELYGPELTETNPPMIIWFSVLPVFLAQLFHASPILMLKIVVLAMVLASTAWAARILRATVINTGSSINNVSLKSMPATVFLLVAAVLAAEMSVSPRDFAEREHLLVLCALPYILAVLTGAARLLPFREQVALGIIAGMGVCFKPQHAVIFVALEIFLTLRSRSLRHAHSPEFLALILTCCTYVVTVRLVTPLFFKETIPLLASTYWAFAGSSFSSLLFNKPSYDLLLLVALVAVVAFRNRLRFSTTTLALLLCSFAASIAYALQTGFKYQRFPQKALLILALLWLAIDVLSPQLSRLVPSSRPASIPLNPWFSSAPRLLFPLVTLLLAVVLSIALAPSMRKWVAQSDRVEAPYVEQVLLQYPAQTPVYLFTTALAHSFPVVVEREMVWSSRFAHLWMMPAIIQNQLGPAGGGAPFKALSAEKVASLAALQRRDTAEDFRRWKPAVVLVERCGPQDTCQGFGAHPVDFLAWFMQSSEFASEWSHYQRQASDEHFGVYTRTR